MRPRENVVVVGATSTIGSALTESLAATGKFLVLAGGRLPGLTDVAGRLPSGSVLDVIPGDFRVADDVESCRRRILDQERVDGFVFLSSELRTGAVSSFRTGELREVYEVNVFAAFVLAQASLARSVPGSSFVFVSSIDAHRHPSGIPSVAYDGSKAALESLAQSIAVECGAQGIRSNCVVPGLIRTAMTEGFFSSEFDDARAAFLHSIPLRRPGLPEEVAALIRFLLSTEAGYISGAIIPIDGGFLSAGV
ncbi:MAG: SDR family oxidoreductase [Caldisericota bacterium]|nr:SDR family oxidoreductase [Caldisericota bacterium]